MEMNIEKNYDKGIYSISIDEKTASLHFRKQEDTIYIDFVQVPYSLNNRGIGSLLVKEMQKDAEDKGYAIVPICGFAKYVIEKK